MTDLNKKGQPRQRRPKGTAGPLGLDEQFIDRSGECWLWTGYVNLKGYGVAAPKPANSSLARSAHKRVWETINGPVPDGLVVDHLCHKPKECAGGPTCLHRRCVRPDHLGLTTSKENVRRGNKSGRKRQAFCKRGHEFTPENTYTAPDGRRSCKTCITENRPPKKTRYRKCGHINTPENTYTTPGGNRQCKECRAARPGLRPSLTDREYCLHGHKVTPDSVYFGRDGVARCKPCSRERATKNRERATKNKTTTKKGT